jgi:hypothetical protein
VPATSKVPLTDEQVLTIPARLCYFLIREYIPSRDVYHVSNDHIAQFSTLYDYIEKGRSKQLKIHRKFKEICGRL